VPKLIGIYRLLQRAAENPHEGRDLKPEIESQASVIGIEHTPARMDVVDLEKALVFIRREEPKGVLRNLDALVQWINEVAIS